MGDAADDAYEAALDEQEQREILREACRCGLCDWFVNAEGLYECRGCGVEVDL